MCEPVGGCVVDSPLNRVAAAAAMSSVQSLREFISERLTAAAEEIFRQFEKTIVQYEEEMDRQRRLLDYSSWKVQANPHRPDLEPPGVFEEDQPLWNQERSSSLRELQVKEEPGSSQERWESMVRQESNVSSMRALFEAESRCEQLLSQIPPVTQDQKGGAYMEFDEDAEEMLQQRPNRRGCTEGAFLPGCDPMNENDNRVCKCSICGKSLKDKYSLKVHNKIHTGEKPFFCHMCGKRFRYKHALKVHVRIHTNEKPFSCRVCGETFRQSSNLINHQKRHQELILVPSSEACR